MGEVQIRFSPEMAYAAIAGHKCCTSRREMKGDPGDEFDIGGIRFRLLDVLTMPVRDITEKLYRLEGFKSHFTCSQTLHYLYPGMSGSDSLWVHFFARCPE